MTVQAVGDIPQIDWNEILKEGERRVQAKFLDALILTHSRDRARLFTQRETVKRKIEQALKEKNGRKLKHAFQEQTKLLRKISRTC